MNENDTIVFQLNTKGKMSFGDGACAHIENDQVSALSVLSNNYVNNGEVFAKDHFVYKDGKKIRKWFQRRGDIKLLWVPNLERVTWIEGIRWRLHEKYVSLWKEIGEVVDEIHKKGDVAYARPLHDFESSSGSEYWKYNIRHSDCSQGLTFGFNWVKKPKRTRNAQLGQRLYYLEHTRGGTLRKRLGLFNKALKLALERNICGEHYIEQKKYKNGQVLRYNINNRLYWYVISYNRYGVLWPEMLHWPETNILDIELK